MPRFTATVLPLLSLFPTVARTQQAIPSLERVEAELEQLIVDAPGSAFAVGAVSLVSEDPTILTVGRLDRRQPFEEWARVPLGTVTQVLLDDALAAVLDGGELGSWNDPLGKHLPTLVEPLKSRPLSMIYEGRAVELPWYFRFVDSGNAARPLDAIVADHAFELVRYERAPGPSMLRVAIVQHALERASGRKWAELLGESAARMGLRSVRDMTSRGDSARLVRGQRADGRSYPVHLAEVAAYGNASASVADLAQMTRACLRATAANADQKTAPKSWVRSFDEIDDDVFDVTLRTLESEMCGVTLRIVLVPESDVAFFLFGNHPRGKWLSALQKAALLDLCGPPGEPAARLAFGLGGGAGGGPRWAPGNYRASVEVGDQIAVVELEVLRNGARAEIHGVSGGEAKARIRWKAIEIHAPLDEGAVDGETLTMEFTIAEKADNLVGVFALRRATADGIDLERLPRPVKFELVEK